MRPLALLALPLLPATTAARDSSLAHARFGQTVYADGPRVTPLRLIEDSRCPKLALCVWAGQVRIAARIRTGRGAVIRELTSNKPIPVADGTIELVEVTPERPQQGGIARRAYRFGFRFSGGL